MCSASATTDPRFFYGARPRLRASLFSPLPTQCIARRGDSSRGGTVGGENGRVQRNANGDVIPPDQAQAYYCGSCWKYIGPTGERVPYEYGAEVIVWTECARCMEKRLEQEVAEERQLQPHTCRLEGCGELFTPVTSWQRYCCPAHRQAAHRIRRKVGYARR